MYYKRGEKVELLDLWSNIDPVKVKQRIDMIAARLEGVRRKFEPESEVSNSCDEKKS